MNIKELIKILKRFPKNTEIELSIVDEDANKFPLTSIEASATPEGSWKINLISNEKDLNEEN